MRHRQQSLSGVMRRQDGFTLIELLVSLALIALIVVFAMNGLDISSRAFKAGRERADQAALEASATALEQQLSRIVKATARGGDGIARLVFIGHPHELTFVALSAGLTQVGGLMLTRLAYSQDRIPSDTAGAAPGQVQLANAVFRPSTAFSSVPNTAKTILFTDVLSFDVGYWGSVASEGTASWFRDWLAPDHLPELIEARIALRARSMRRILTVSVRIHAAS